MKYLAFILYLLVGVTPAIYCQQSSKPPVFPLQSLALDSDYQWLEKPFSNEINDSVRFVGLGEFSHGGKETILFKSKMIQYLIKNKGYRTLMIEYPNVFLRRINDYLLNKTAASSDSVKIIAQNTFGRTFLGNTSFYDLLVWLKRYNLSQPNDMFTIGGFDIEGASIGFADYFMNNFLAPFDSQYASEIHSKWPHDAKDSITVAELIWFKDHKKNLEEKLNAVAYRNIVYNVKAAEDKLTHQKLQKINFYKASAFRDSIMASNITAFNDAKTIIWSHNMHITTSDYVVSLGNYLNASVGKQYYCVLTDFFNPATVWSISNEGILSKKTFNPNPKTTSYLIHKKTGIDNGIVLFKNLKSNQVQLNTIDRVGNQFTLGKGHAFDALVILGRVEPFVFN
ncbi:erythromycin esterase family protein [Mucilaginibacter sp. SMC90]|uniref:erythromycin esterase family protein n=1 Tax=Mucilaginibacter sp. SMC90 TaxID=2929803 RepID=UPI001FB3A645|nr:erythromycin esterase family protein [Mucilaginibacter sp. SMC90]UOE52662.1 erythromycin esterase family protein [Mucilaginibacter sp. SMC90]